MSEVITIGLDIAKYVFHAHAASDIQQAGQPRKAVGFLRSPAELSVALEACGGAHRWARQLTQLGHEAARLCKTVREVMLTSPFLH